MKTLIITSNYGRFGNNFIALLNAIIICLQNNYDRLFFPKIDFLGTREIIFNITPNTDSNEECIHISGYDAHVAKEHGHLKYHVNPKEIFDKYLRHHFNINQKSPNIYTLYTRADDIFNYDQIMDLYTPAPLYFYDIIMKKENMEYPLLISQDLRNPVAEYLVKNNLVKWNQQNFNDDIIELVNSKILIIGFSTMLYFVILYSNTLKKIYMPDFVHQNFLKLKINIKEILRKDQELIIIEIPNYPMQETMKKMPDLGYSTILKYQPT